MSQHVCVQSSSGAQSRKHLWLSASWALTPNRIAPAACVGHVITVLSWMTLLIRVFSFVFLSPALCLNLNWLPLLCTHCRPSLWSLTPNQTQFPLTPAITLSCKYTIYPDSKQTYLGKYFLWNCSLSFGLSERSNFKFSFDTKQRSFPSMSKVRMYLFISGRKHMEVMIVSSI